MSRTRMGQLFGKSVSRVNNALKEIECINKTGKFQANATLEIFKELDNKIIILKSELEFITRDLQKLDSKKSNNATSSLFHESATQTEGAIEKSCSQENHTLKKQNENLEKEIAQLKGHLRQDETSAGGSSIACKAVFSGDDKLFPAGSELKEQYVRMQREYEKVLIEKDIAMRERDDANFKIRKIEAELREMEEHKKQIQEVRCDHSKIIQEKENTIMEFKRDLDDKIKKNEEQEKIIRNLQQQIEQTCVLINEKDKQMHLKDQQKNEKDSLIAELKGIKDDTEKELVSTKRRLEQAQTFIEDSKKQLLDKTKDLKMLRTKLTDTELKVKDIDSRREDATSENYRLKTELQRLSEVEKCNRDLQKFLGQMEHNYTARGEVIEERKSEIMRKDEKIKQKECELNILQKEMENVTKKLEQSVSTLHHQLEETVLENEKIKSQQIKLTEENLRIQNELDIAKQKNMEIKQKKRLLSEEKTGIQNELDNLQEKINKTLEEKTRLHCQLDHLNKIFNTISSQNDDLRQENESLKQEKEKLAAKALVKRSISFHTVLKQPQSKQAESGIVSHLQQELGVTLEIIPESKRSKNVPLLVVLYNLSKITDDVKGALIGIEASSDVALVILHSKEVVKASEQILTHVDFKKLGIIVDISFISAKGIISNEVTSGGIQQLAKFIKMF